MSGILLQNGKQDFKDANGRPLSGGRVFFFEPGTQSPKDTYQDAAQTILNTNPIILDARGEAVIYGSGAYRQVLRDASLNQIWDQNIPDALSSVNDSIGPLLMKTSVVVANIAELRALKSTASKNAFVLGYYSSLDGGGGQYTYDATDSASADNGGTIIVATDGSRWKLAYVNGPTARQFGCKGDGVADDATPLQNFLNLGGDGFITLGTYNSSKNLTQTTRMRLRGDGRGLTKIVFTGTTGNGLTVTPPTGGEASRFWKWEGISILPKTPKAGSYAMHIVLNTGCFLSNFDILDCEFGDFGLRGLCLDNSVGNGDGFFTGTVKRCWITNGLRGLKIGDSMTFADNTITGKNCGIDITGVAGARQMLIDNNNITTSGGTIALINVEQAFITNNQLEQPGYLGASGAYDGPYGAFMYFASCFKPTIRGNTINPNNGASTVSAAAIVADGTTYYIDIENNDINKGASFHFIFASTTLGHRIAANNRYYGATPTADDQSVGIKGLQKTLTLTNSWTTLDASVPTPGFYRDSDGFVNLTGTIKGGTGTAATLPAGFRPALYQIYATTGPSNTTPSQITVGPDGTIVPAGTNTKCGLDGVRFRVAD